MVSVSRLTMSCFWASVKTPSITLTFTNGIATPPE
jgi:hypothetical protein